MITTYLITGFLGAGKTTFLNQFLSTFSNQQVIVIENEIGAINIDQTLLNKKIDSVVPLSNGCICCDLDTELFNVLGELISQETPPEVLIIESTGIADPGNIQKLFHTQEVKEYYHLASTICLVDVTQWEARMQDTVECGKQISRSDVLLLNKVDLVSEEKVAQVQHDLQIANPFTPIVRASQGKIDFTIITDPAEPIKRPWKYAPLTMPTESHIIRSVLFETETKITPTAFLGAMQLYFYQYPNQLYRIKGYLKGDDHKNYLIQSVGDYIKMEETETPVENTGLVFIGKNLKEATVQRLMKPLLNGKW
ncbi:MAG: CobW family GTP-binding protein [Cytophagaceae bacterium]